MCDCYMAKCNNKKCKKKLNLHLGDHNTARDEIEVFCGRHIPKDNCRIFISLSEKPFQGRRIRKGWKMGIRSLTENAKNNEDDNCPNEVAEFLILDA